MKFILETKSNIFIDSGSKILTFEYDIIDKDENKEVLIYDFEKFIEYLYLNENYLNKNEEVLRKLENLILKLTSNKNKYTSQNDKLLHFSGIIKELNIDIKKENFLIGRFKFQGKNSNKEISLFMGGLEHNFIPGSTIKAGFRNAYIYNKNNLEKSNEEIKELKGLIVRDTISNIKDLLIIKEGFNFMNFKKNSISFLELIPVGKKRYINIEFNSVHQRNEIFNFSKKYSLSLIKFQKRIINYYLENKIKKELSKNFNKKLEEIEENFENILYFLDMLENEINSELNNPKVTYLKLGKYTGWYTDPVLLKKFQNMNIKEIFKSRNDKRKGLGIKSMSVDKEDIPFGWVRLYLE